MQYCKNRKECDEKEAVLLLISLRTDQNYNR